MNIYIGHYSHPNDVSGVTTWMINFIEELSKYDHINIEVLLIEYQPYGHKSAIKEFLNKQDIVYRSIQHHIYTEDNVKNILNYFNDKVYNLFIPYCIESLYYSAYILDKIGLPYVFTMHSDDPVYWDNIKILVQHGLKNIVSVSKYMSNECKNLFDIDSKIIPYGVKLSTITKSPINNHKIIYIGRIVDEQKRIALVLDTMRALCTINPTVTCKIVGGGPLESWLFNELKNNDCDGRIIFTGRVEPEQVKSYLLDHSIQLLMSDYEGFPVSILESMSMGVIPASRVLKSGISELINDGYTGILLSDEPYEAALKLNECINDEQLMQSIRNNLSVGFAEQYSIENNVKKWIALINDCALKNSITVHTKDIGYKLHNTPKVLVKRDRRRPSRFKRILKKLNQYIRG
jgi:glycosyltransferase involved in cell wall biosynthesis